MTRDRTAALVVIGNEILSGKVVDTNSVFLAAQLHALGVSLRRIVVIPDETDVIADTIAAVMPAHDVVFTSGGVGPTHDDLTIAGLAQGLGRRVVHDQALLALLQRHFGEDVSGARLKMAEVVEGTELLADERMGFPTMQLENIFVLPGIPEIFREKVLSLRERLAVEPFFLRTIYSGAQESTLAEYLNRTLAEFPELLLGSYPKLNHPEYRVRITLESKDRAYLERAFSALLAMLPSDVVVRTE
jgi:molybdenum cofactor synthesis domain-containing protein